MRFLRLALLAIAVALCCSVRVGAWPSGDGASPSGRGPVCGAAAQDDDVAVLVVAEMVDEDDDEQTTADIVVSVLNGPVPLVRVSRTAFLAGLGTPSPGVLGGLFRPPRADG